MDTEAIKMYEHKKPLALKPPHNGDGVRIWGKWVTTGYWLLPLSAHKSLTNGAKPLISSKLARIKLNKKTIDSTIPNRGKVAIPLGNPNGVQASDKYASEAVTFDMPDIRFGLNRRYYDWITRRLKLSIARPVNPISPIPILNKQRKIIGAIMPVSLT